MNDSGQPTDPAALAKACTEALYLEDLAAQRLGITVLDSGPGCAKLHMTVRRDMVNGHLICHGGMLFALADTAFAYACNSRNERCLATACTIDYLHPASAGEQLVATAHEKWRAGRTGVYDVEVKNDDEELIAVFRGKSFATGRAVLDLGQN